MARRLARSKLVGSTLRAYVPDRDLGVPCLGTALEWTGFQPDPDPGGEEDDTTELGPPPQANYGFGYTMFMAVRAVGNISAMNSIAYPIRVAMT